MGFQVYSQFVPCKMKSIFSVFIIFPPSKIRLFKPGYPVFIANYLIEIFLVYDVLYIMHIAHFYRGQKYNGYTVSFRRERTRGYT